MGLRLAAAAGCALAPALCVAALGFPAQAALTGALLALAGLVTLAAPAAAVARAAASLRVLARPGVQAAALAVGGGGLLVGGIARFESARDRADQADIDFMMDVTWKPPTREAVDVRAWTDAGRPVALHEPVTPRSRAESAGAERRALDVASNVGRMIRTGPPDDTANCHGWVFTGGRFWLSPDGVAAILADNGYQPVSDPRPGDVVIYRSGELITHTAAVRIAESGGPVLAESKWGWMGVFLHAPDASPYGREYTFYRSARHGHLLAGLGGPATPAVRGPDHRDPGVGD